MKQDNFKAVVHCPNCGRVTTFTKLVVGTMRDDQSYMWEVECRNCSNKFKLFISIVPETSKRYEQRLQHCQLMEKY